MKTLSKKEKIVIALAVPIVLVIAVFIIPFSSDKAALFPYFNKTQVEEPAAPVEDEEPEGIIIIDKVVGTGVEAKDGDTVTVHYTGTLDDKTVFDSSYSRNEPFTFMLGVGRVIKGWDIGINGMKVGGKRYIVMLPELGYGDKGVKNGAGQYVIMPNQTLTFDVELLNVESSQ